ncbi:MAG: hypothetical protein ABJN52_00225 [Litorimonas sp.]
MLMAALRALLPFAAAARMAVYEKKGTLGPRPWHEVLPPPTCGVPYGLKSSFLKPAISGCKNLRRTYHSVRLI